MAPRGARRAESNGEWVLTKIIPGIIDIHYEKKSTKLV
jgi:hypothetical protein